MQQQPQFMASPPTLHHPTPTHPPAPLLSHPPPGEYGGGASMGTGGGGDFQAFMPFQELTGSAATQLGVQFGKSAFVAGQQYVQQNVPLLEWDLTIRIDGQVCSPEHRQVLLECQHQLCKKKDLAGVIPFPA